MTTCAMNDTLPKELDKFRCAIVVVGLTPPSGRVRSWRVDTREGNIFWIWPDKAHLLRINEEFDVEGTVRDTYYNIYKVQHLGPAPEEDHRPATVEVLPPQRNRKKMDYYRPRDPDEQRQIWVCALLGREIEWRGGRPPMTERELLDRAAIYAAVWDRLFGSTTMEDVNDDQA